MKKQINWNETRSDIDFQGLCNKILYWEVSKDVVPFGALGRDKATDAQFEGTYNNKTGKWRFQAKFHDPTMDNARARALVRSEFKKELEKIKEEKPNYYVFMTNVKITKTTFDEMMSIASKYDFETQIWDGEKLETILPKYPFIIAYHFGYDLPLFEPYQEKFKEELEGKKPIINHDCPFQGRTKALELVEKLLSEEAVKILLVSGHRGIGKTRFAIESAKRVEQTEEWTPLFLRAEAEKFEEHLNELSAEKKYVIIADDGDAYPHITKLIALANRHGWLDKTKVIILTKPQSLDALKKSMFPQYGIQQVVETSIGQLSNQETLNLLSDLRVKEEDDQRRLFPVCKDAPMLTIMAVNLFREGTPPERMSQEEVVSKTLDKSLDGLRKDNKTKHLRFLEILSAISPVDIRDENIHNIIASVIKIDVEEEKEIVQDLLKEELIETRGAKIRITPDILSDHILNSKCFDGQGRPTGFHKKIIEEFLNVASKQVITNFAEAEFKSKTGKTLLDDFTEDIVNSAPKANNVQRMSTLTVLDEFSYYRPLDALEIIEKMMKNPQPGMTYEDKLWGQVAVTTEMVTQRIPLLLKKTAYTLEALPTALNLLKEIALKEEMKKQRLGDSANEILKQICSLEYGRDIWIKEEEKRFYYNEKWHEKILETLSEWLKKDSEELNVLALELMKNLSRLGCNYARTSLQDRSTFVYSTIKIPRTKNLSAFREKLFKLTFETAEKTKYLSVKSEAYKVLGGAISEISGRAEADEGRSKKETNQEKKKIFDFLKEAVNKETHPMILNLIETYLGYFARSIKGYKQKAASLIEELSSKDEYRLYKYLVGRHDDWDTTTKPSFWENLTKEYIEKYEANQISDLLSRVLEQTEQGWFFGPVTAFMLNIGKLKPDYGIKLLNRILQEKKKLLDYAGYLLTGIRLEKKEEAVKYLNQLKDDEDIRVKRVVTSSYDRLKGYKEFTQQDIEILKHLSTTDDDILKAMIADVLPNLFGVDQNTYLEILKNVSKKPSLQTAGNVADALVKADTGFVGKYLDDVKEIVGNFIGIESLNTHTMASHYIERVLNKIGEHDPLWVIEFFEKRVDQTQEKREEDSKYDAIPFSFSETFKDLSKHEKYRDVFRRVRDWTMKKGWFYIEAPNFFKNLCTRNGGRTLHTYLDAEAEEVLMEWVNSGDVEKMIGAAHLLRHFEEDERFYRICKELIVKSGGDSDVSDKVSSAIFTSEGATSRTRGQPSPRLLKRIEYLKKLRDTSDNIKVKRFAEKEIKSAEGQIEWELERDEELA